ECQGRVTGVTGAPPPASSSVPSIDRRLAMTTVRAEKVLEQVEAALAERRHLPPTHLAAREVASRIARRYHDLADGTSGLWIARARWAAADGRASGRALYELPPA